MSSVVVVYFAAARELVGHAQDEVPMTPARQTAGDVLRAVGARHARLAPLLHRMRVAVNGEFASLETPVSAGDELAVLPPVAGGSPGRSDGPDQTPPLCEVTSQPLTAESAIAAVGHPGAGGIDVFIGVVRDHAEGKSVGRLDYEAHPTLAVVEMRRVLEEVARSHPGTVLAAQHRVGSLQVGDVAVVVAASAPHREAAFAACRAAIDTLKDRVPIWKKEWAADGTAHWVNLESDPR